MRKKKKGFVTSTPGQNVVPEASVPGPGDDTNEVLRQVKTQ